MELGMMLLPSHQHGSRDISTIYSLRLKGKNITWVTENLSVHMHDKDLCQLQFGNHLRLKKLTSSTCSKHLNSFTLVSD